MVTEREFEGLQGEAETAEKNTRNRLEAGYRQTIQTDFRAAVKALDKLAESYEMCADDLNLHGKLGDNPRFLPAYGSFERLSRTLVVIARSNAFALVAAEAIVRDEEDEDEPNGGRLLREGGLKGAL